MTGVKGTSRSSGEIRRQEDEAGAGATSAGLREDEGRAQSSAAHDMGDLESGARRPVYGAESDDFWIGTSSIMLCITYAIVVALASIVCWQFIMFQYEKHVVAWVIGAVFVMISVPLALQDIHFHILHYVSPLQRHYIRILWMIPIYAVESWLALRFNKQKIYLETMREAYEAYVVYSFFKLMREFLGDKPRALKRLRRIQDSTGHKTANKLITCWLCPPSWRLDSQFLTRSALGVYQYVVLRTTCAAIACILEQWHMFGEGHYDTGHFYIYYVVIVNTSQCWALWCLVLFYHVFKEDLRPISPLPKFLVIKAVVFISWWQGIIIMYMAHEHMIKPVLDYSSEDVAKGLQNLLICAEMLLYGIAHHYIFTYKDFKSDGKLADWLQDTKATKKTGEAALKEMLPVDVLEEGKGYVERVPKYVGKHIPDGLKDLPDKLHDKLPTIPNPIKMLKHNDGETGEKPWSKDKVAAAAIEHAVHSQPAELQFADRDMSTMDKNQVIMSDTKAQTRRHQNT